MAESDSEHSGGALDPFDRVSEVVFGVLMAMTFIGALSVASDGREEVRTAMIAALGCNIAWGLTDGVMYLVGILTERTRRRTLARRAGAPEGAAARLHAADFKAALVVFVLVAVATFPMVVPFLVFDRMAPALLGSRLVAIAVLFLCGWMLARHAGGNRWLAGAGMAAIGALLIGALMALGG